MNDDTQNGGGQAPDPAAPMGDAGAGAPAAGGDMGGGMAPNPMTPPADPTMGGEHHDEAPAGAPVEPMGAPAPMGEEHPAEAPTETPAAPADATPGQ